MNPPPNSTDPRSVAFRLRVDDICSAFETAFNRETSARIEPFMQNGAEADRSDILAELIRTERECRQMIGDDPTADEYLARFPHDAATVRTVFADATLKSGDRIGKYVIVEKLGAGGMGVVYRATDDLVGRPVALKMLAAQLTTSATARERLIAEARSVGRISHPNVVTLYDAGNEQGTCYLVMEYVAGGSAADRLAKHEKFEWREAVAVIADVCRGLSAAHAAGLVHLDIKPANILLANRTDGTVGTIGKVSDFGLARHATNSDESERIAGTPRYMAPEQMAGLSTDARTDVYGVGATLYALLTGAPPRIATEETQSPPPDPRTISFGVPASVSRTVLRALHPSPQKRHQSIGELLDELEKSLSERPRPTRWLTATLAVAVLIGCGFLVRHLAFRPNTPVDAAATSPSAEAPPPAPDAAPEVGPWEPLFDGKTLAGWEARRGPPPNLLERSKPRENDPVFSVTTVDNHPAIRGVPDGDSRLTTLRGFENYQLRLEYRWGKPDPAERSNAGVLYHYQLVPLDDQFSKARFMELDLWPPEVGHLHSLPDVSLKRETIDPRNYELPYPAWNRVDLLCVGGRGVHVINGHVTLSYRDARIVFGREETPYTGGRIQLQSMSGEVFFRNVRVRTIQAISSGLYE